MKEQILSNLTAECPWRDTLYWFDTIDSTNTRAKELANGGAPHGTVLIAGNQSAGRGRMGRSFQSPEGQGVYLSVILRPECTPAELMHLTCAAGVAMANAVETTCGIRPQLKWINDLVCGHKKLGGILTEMSFVNGRIDYAVVGIGINCLQAERDFPPEISQIATSLAIVCNKPIAPAQLAANMILAFWDMDQSLLTQKQRWMAAYKANCITLGKEIQVIQGDCVRLGKAVDMDDDGGLIVEYTDGTVQTVVTGEVSVRGMYGYV